MTQNILTVTEVNQLAATLLERDPVLRNLQVKGELSNVKRYSSGHIYFALKDSEAQISCVMFRGQAARLTFEPKDGQAVVLSGRATIYVRDGRFQLYADSMQLEGQGDLFAAYLALKAELEAKGWFDPKLKRLLPLLPGRVGVVTSPSGAVIRDIINVAGRRFPNFNLLLVPVQVQGELAAGQIAAAIDYLNADNSVDVIIVGRGGGSIEDLWCFNDIRVATSIRQSHIPVVSAVGHETDFTIADFVADVRAPTPSAAAELVWPQADQLIENIEESRRHLRRLLTARTDYAHLYLSRAKGRLEAVSPARRLEQQRQTIDQYLLRLTGDIKRRSAETRVWLDSLNQRMKQAFERRHTVGRAAFQESNARLRALNPLSVLQRGYSIVTNAEGDLLTTVERVRERQKVTVVLSDGRLGCEVNTVEPDRRAVSI
ncbi:MAG: exodeoxyribonuclease VII large subunit [Clostridiaceae bacterium]|nr:exodeoxyribonuclease VII large subunit [Clostridiaceae bacterium]